MINNTVTIEREEGNEEYIQIINQMKREGRLENKSNSAVIQKRWTGIILLLFERGNNQDNGDYKKNY